MSEVLCLEVPRTPPQGLPRSTRFLLDIIAEADRSHSPSIWYVHEPLPNGIADATELRKVMATMLSELAALLLKRLSLGLPNFIKVHYKGPFHALGMGLCTKYLPISPCADAEEAGDGR